MATARLESPEAPLSVAPLGGPAQPDAASETRRVRLLQLARLPGRYPLQRLDGRGHVEVDHGVELLGQPGVEVMAEPFRLGQVNDPNGPLQARLAQRRPGRRLP